MKIIRTISITSQEFFEELCQNLCKTANVGLPKEEMITMEELMKGKTVIRNKNNVFKKDRFTIDAIIPNQYMKGHISSAIEESVFEYQVESLQDGCTVTSILEVNKKLEKEKSKAGKIWEEALTSSRMVNEIKDIEKKVLKRKQK